MNREIKFRAWHKEAMVMEYSNKMFKGDFDYWDGCKDTRLGMLNDILRNNVDDIVWMQYTGLKDKNGKEIYEGDIIRILYTDWCSKSNDDNRTLEQYLVDISRIGFVDFSDSSWVVKIKNRYGEYTDNSIYHGKHGFIEIIGNLYENPELLTNK